VLFRLTSAVRAHPIALTLHSHFRLNLYIQTCQPMIRGNWETYEQKIRRFHPFDPIAIDHFTVFCSVSRPLNASKAAGHLALIKKLTAFDV